MLKLRNSSLKGSRISTEIYKGAQNPKYMGNPSIEQLQAWQEAAQGKLIKLALSPEREGVADFIKEATKQGVTIALGHSNATYEEAMAAVEAGASVWVHVYNGMRGFSHREPVWLVQPLILLRRLVN